MFCEKCGKEVDEVANFCGSCGQVINDKDQQVIKTEPIPNNCNNHLKNQPIQYNQYGRPIYAAVQSPNGEKRKDLELQH